VSDLNRMGMTLLLSVGWAPADATRRGDKVRDGDTSMKSDAGYFCPCPAMRRPPRSVPEGYLSYAEQMARGRANGAKHIRRA
jgi:hypothetical protein